VVLFGPKVTPLLEKMDMSFWLPLILALLPLAASAQPDMSAPEALAAGQSGKVKLIDIRTPQEWRQTGVAPGAGRVDMYRGAEHLLRGVLQEVGGDRNAPIALICRTGNRTTQAQKFLQQQGFTQVFNVKEGMAGSAAGPGWLRRGLPVERCAEC
jgi:rhodanese-related sulfurtransferase